MKKYKNVVKNLLEKESEKDCYLQYRFKMPKEIKELVGTEDFTIFAVEIIKYFEANGFDLVSCEFDENDKDYYIVTTAPRSLDSLIIQVEK